MQATHNYYPSDGYSSSNLIEIDDPYSSYQTAASSSSLLLPQHDQQCHDDQLMFKKRRIERACDACRRRKTKCDGPRMPDNVCSNCLQTRKSCTYIEVSKPRGPPKAYITGLEDRLEKMEALLRRLRPETDFSAELGPPVIRDSWKTDTDTVRQISPKSTSPCAPPQRAKGSPTSSSQQSVNISTPIPPSSRASNRSPRNSTPRISLTSGMKRLTLRGLEAAAEIPGLADSQNRFHGKSSSFKLIGPARKLREEHMNTFTKNNPYVDGSVENSNPTQKPALRPSERRPEFWNTPPWELAFEGFKDGFENLCSSLTAEFPPPDLADNLIKLYFRHVNSQFPLFHRPTFERQWRDGLAEKDPWFGGLCLSMFAVASRWSDDPRVLTDGFFDMPESEGSNQDIKWQRAGWSYLNAAADIHRATRTLLHPANLFEVQTFSVMAMFLRGTAFHPVAWLFISVGLRKAQDVGAHRKKVYGNKPSVDEELWKRAFWMLVLYDRIGSAALGRPCCSGEEDFDVDLPLEVDDEYWELEDPTMTFQQPSDKPSVIAAFNSHLKLTKIAAYALRTIYAIDRSRLIISAARPQWGDVLTQLNTAMTEWVDSVPSHLRWSSQIEDQLFANQAATLYTTYYVIQILIYRPFLPSSLHALQSKAPHSTVPSIAICVNAGKCCARILRAQTRRGLSNIPNLICTSHMCAAVLLMNFWDLKAQERVQLQSGLMEDVKTPLAYAMAELLEDVSVFTNALELVRPRWRNADVYLRELSSSMPHTPEDRYDEPPLSAHQTYQSQSRSYAPVAESRAAATSTYPYTMPPSGGPPHWFDFPHVTTTTDSTAYPPWMCLRGTDWSQQQVGHSPRQLQQRSSQSRPASYAASIQNFNASHIIPSISAVRKPSLSSLSSGASVDAAIGGGMQYEALAGPSGHVTSGTSGVPHTRYGVNETGWERGVRYNWQNGWEHTHAGYGMNTANGGAMVAGQRYSGGVPPQPVVAAPLKGENEYPRGHILSYGGHY